MDDQKLIISDEDITELKKELEQHKKREEYEALKRDLYDISYKANNALTEFDGGMKQVDTERALKRKDGKETLSDIITNRFLKLCNLRAISGNLIAIGLAFIAIFFLHYYLDTKELHPFIMGTTYFMEIAIAFQILKSANRSVALPVLTLFISSIALTQIHGDQTLLQHPVLFFKVALVVAIISLAISVFSID